MDRRARGCPAQLAKGGLDRPRVALLVGVGLLVVVTNIVVTRLGGVDRQSGGPRRRWFFASRRAGVGAAPAAGQARGLDDGRNCHPPYPTPSGCGTTSRAGRLPGAHRRRRLRHGHRRGPLPRRLSDRPAPNPFPSICGRVCAAPCETACRRGSDRRARSRIRALKRFVTERFGVESFAGSSVWHEAHGPVPPATLGPRSASIGGGPAGLAAALRAAPGRASGDRLRGRRTGWAG